MPALLPSEQPCPAFDSDRTLLVDRELADHDRARLETHLAQCPACRHAVAAARTLRERLHAACHVAAPAGLRSRLGQALAQEPTPEVSAPKGTADIENISARPRRPRWARPLPMAAAGATALGLCAWLYFAPRHDDLTNELVARHSRQLPLELHSSDPRVLESWLEDKVGFRVRVPRLQRNDLVLVGARLSHVRDHTAVHLLYGDRRSPMRRVSMLVYDDPSGGVPVPDRAVDTLGIHTARSAGYHVSAWRKDALVYSLVADDDEVAAEVEQAAFR